MKIICTQENLKTGLATVGRIISSTNTLPILNNLLIKTENGLLKISATNLEIAITTSIRCKIEEEGGVTVVSRAFIDLVNNLPNKNLTLQTSQNQLSVEAENYHTSIKTLPTDDFPLIPSINEGSNLNLDAQELRSALDQVSFAASTNQTQPEISGILFVKDSDGLRIAATDRYRLAERKLSLPQGGGVVEAIVPQKTVVEISRIIGPQKGNVELVFSETQVLVSFNDTQIISRLVDGQYPDYRQIIPVSFTTTAVTGKNPFISALRAAAVFSQNNNSVKMEVVPGKNEVVLETESSELGKTVVELPANIEGKNTPMLLNYHYLLDCLGSITTDNVIIKTIDDGSPALFVPEGKEDYLYLVMPIKS